MLLDDLSRSVVLVKTWLGDCCPRLAIVLGSGLDGLLPQLSHVSSLDYFERPDFSFAPVVGQVGRSHAAVSASGRDASQRLPLLLNAINTVLF
jgi:purine nucleoside phosphorylase